MRCPLCSPIGAVEGPLLNHMLREHPEAQAVAALALPTGSVLLARRPTGLLVFYVGLAVLALLISAPSTWPRS